MIFRYLYLFLAILLLFGSSPSFISGDSPDNVDYSLQTARTDLEGSLANIPGFVGIGHAGGQIILLLENEAAKGIAPDSYNGFAIRKMVTGRIKAVGYPGIEAPVLSLPGQVMEALSQTMAKQENISRDSTFRPLKGGISIFSGVSTSWVGTLGMITYENWILSCAHVIAMNPDTNNFLALGTSVIQPAGTSGSRVGALQQYIPITFNSNSAQNYADAAVATIDNGIGAVSGLQYGEAGDYSVSGTTTVAAGDTVRKSGRTTGVTTGTVSATNVTVIVDYSTNGTKWARFVDQIMVSGPFISGGDSGSCVDKNGQFVGMAFASGTSNGNQVSFVCKASYIISRLGISVTPSTIPTVTNASGATSIMATTAILNGNLTYTGGLDTTVIIYGGTTDGQTTIANWGHSDILGIRSAGPFSLGVTGLTPNMIYYYRCYAENSAGTSWAPSSSSFTTQADLGLWKNYWEGPGKDWYRYSSGHP